MLFDTIHPLPYGKPGLRLCQLPGFFFLSFFLSALKTDKHSERWANYHRPSCNYSSRAADRLGTDRSAVSLTCLSAAHQTAHKFYVDLRFSSSNESRVRSCQTWLWWRFDLHTLACQTLAMVFIAVIQQRNISLSKKKSKLMCLTPLADSSKSAFRVALERK